jgi:ribosome biogenesis protein Nip4
MIKLRESYSSDEEFLDVFLRKVDAIMGSQESFLYLEEIKKRVKDNEQGMGKRP